MKYSSWGILIPITSIIITLLLTYILAPAILWDVAHPDEDETHDFPSYKDCAPSICGNSTIRYPFGKCGVFSVHCIDNQRINLQYGTAGQLCGRVIGDITESSYSTRTLQIAQNIPSSSCWPHLLSSNRLYTAGSIYYPQQEQSSDSEAIPGFSEAYTAGSIYNCTQEPREIYKNMTWLDWGETDSHYLFYNGTDIVDFPGCKWYSDIIVPADKKYNISGDKNFERLSQKGIQMTWDHMSTCDPCEASGGRCYGSSDSYFYDSGSYVYDSGSYVYCICSIGDVHYNNCSDGYPIGKIASAGLMAGIFLAAGGLFSIVVVFCIVIRRRQTCCCKNADSEEEQSIRAFMDPLDSRPPSVENFLNYYSSQAAPTRYSYTQIMIYTNNLADRVGKGGFGTVYKGKLPSGRLIAVKILDESKQSEQQFIAEVATVGTTCHVNLVRLLGYCSQGSRRALVYEYMDNGSLEKYIHGDHQDELDWKQLYTIALGTARGIAYLHDECRNRILHFDIKPHNVLLDGNFLPKVADFGLAKIYDREESHISVANRGTLGYAAPEMWSGMYGAVTDRSDVYSYGMLIMEVVGGRKNIDLETTSSRFFYPEWAFKQVVNCEFGNLRKGNMSEEEQEIAKKLSLVGLWCIQFTASHRPSMSRVIQMLEGGADITTPPFPFPVDPNPPPQIYAPGQSSSNYTSEVEMIDPKRIDTAKTSPGNAVLYNTS